MMSKLENPALYTDLAGLNAITQTGKGNTPEGLRQVAEQFESIFLHLMLKTMRDTNKVFSEGNYLSSFEMDFHQQNFDQQLSLQLTQGEGIGLADVLFKQMMRQYEQGREGLEKPASPATGLSGLEASQAADTNRKDLAANRAAAEADINSPEDFVGLIYDAAVKVAKRIGIDPKVLVAQSALETGWGRKIIQNANGGSSFNLFGIKADRDWNGDKAVVTTLEYRNGLPVKEKAAFRAYRSFEESLNDYVDFLLSHPRYSEALNKVDNPEDFAEGLQKAGYATDPVYAEKIKRVMRSDTLQVAMANTAKEV